MSEKDPTEEKPCLDDVGSEELGEAEEESPEEEAPLSSPDSLVTNTVTLPSPDPSVLHGDYQMEDYKGLPELTLALIKPDGMEHVIGIERRMRNEGFNIVQVGLRVAKYSFSKVDIVQSKYLKFLLVSRNLFKKNLYVMQ